MNYIDDKLQSIEIIETNDKPAIYIMNNSIMLEPKSNTTDSTASAEQNEQLVSYNVAPLVDAKQSVTCIIIPKTDPGIEPENTICEHSAVKITIPKKTDSSTKLFSINDLKKIFSAASLLSNVDFEIEEILPFRETLLEEPFNYDYLKKFTSAPEFLFDKPFPTQKNFFEIGHKLEGIDPKNEAQFCPMTVVETCGYRLKLHFDGYPATFYFWVNADSPDIFHVNWCKENKRTLQPPKDYKKKFNWNVYLCENDGTPAPRDNFVSTKNVCNVGSNSFKTGFKCEALDITTRTSIEQKIYVATIADVLGDRVRIHFDGWEYEYDYWTDIASNNLHPIGWCDKHCWTLNSPVFFPENIPFSWPEYLKETNSKAVPESGFICRPLRVFNINMAIEVVDLVVPSLIRVAVIVDVRRGDELKILYDGFNREYAYWIPDNNPDIHPIGWCYKTNHPLEIPLNQLWYCKVIGCNGKGSTDCLKSYHLGVDDCPYKLERWKEMVDPKSQHTLSRLNLKTKRERKKKIKRILLKNNNKIKETKKQQEGKQQIPKLNVPLKPNGDVRMVL